MDLGEIMGPLCSSSPCINLFFSCFTITYIKSAYSGGWEGLVVRVAKVQALPLKVLVVLALQ